jgi:signal transduction histidine kinase
MSLPSPDTLVDRSLAGAFMRFRLPALVGWLAVGLLIGIIRDWPTGVTPVVVTVLGVAHAVYERRRPHPDLAIGIAIDVIVLLYAVWLSGAPNPLMAFAMMFVVMAALLFDGWRRGLLLLEVFVVTGLALIIDGPYHLTTGTQWFYDLLVLQPISVVVIVLSLATEELHRAEVQRGYVLGTVAHELRNDLTPVVGMASVLYDTLSENGDSELAEMAEITVAQATMASETVDDLLTMARIDRDSLELDLHAIDLCAAVSDILDRYGWNEPDRRCRTRHVEVLADPVRLHQIVRNLCSNARQYGGEMVDVVVESDRSGRCHVLVRDNGAGIAAEDLTIVFEPFGRGSAGRMSQASVGLGLWLSRKLAQAMDGDLTYRREEGWSVFDLSLPALGEPPAASNGARVRGSSASTIPRHSMLPSLDADPPGGGADRTRTVHHFRPLPES